MSDAIKAVKHVVQVDTITSKTCDYCNESLGGADRFEESVNHYLQVHGCVLLHMGQLTTFDSDYKPWQGVVAMLGSSTVPPPRVMPSIRFASHDESPHHE